MIRTVGTAEIPPRILAEMDFFDILPEMGVFDGMMGNAGRIDAGQAAQEFSRLLSNNEQIHIAYRLVRDVFLFTDRRLILIDKQGVTGRKTSYHSVLYKSITQFSVETAGTFDLDAELKLWVSGNPLPVQRQFNRQVDIYEVQAILAHYLSQ